MRGQEPKVSLADVLLSTAPSSLHNEVATSKVNRGRGRGRSSADTSSSSSYALASSTSLVAFQNKRTQLKRLTNTSMAAFHKELTIHRNTLEDPEHVRSLDEGWTLKLISDPSVSAMRGNGGLTAPALTKEQRRDERRRRKLGLTTVRVGDAQGGDSGGG